MKLIAIIILSFFFIETEAQVKKSVRELFNVPKSECKIYAFKVDSCLKALGIYKDQKDEYIKKNDNIEIATEKIMLGTKPTDKKIPGGRKFLDGYDFLIDIAANEISINPSDKPSDQRYEFTYGVLEIGFRTEELAKAAYLKSDTQLKKLGIIFHPTPYYAPNACCFRVGKSVIFFYTGAIHIKYLSIIQTWKDESKRPKFD